MSERVYLFVDESGRHTDPDLYVVTGCWCLTPFTDVNRILRPTKNRLSDNIIYPDDGPSSGREIKGTKTDHRKLDSALMYLRKIGDLDKTITSTALPWDARYPIRFTTYELDSELGIELAREYLSEGRSHFTTQVIGLLSVVSPLLRLGSHHHEPIDSFHVILDDNTWKTPGRKVRNFLGAIDPDLDVEFSPFDSKSVPGLQLADVVAHARRQWLRNGNCARASAALNEMRL